MDNNSLATSPHTPPVGKPLRIIIAVVALCLMVTIFVLCILSLQKTGREPGEKPASSVTGSTEDAEKRHLQHVKRVGLQELKHRISMIQSDIDEFESEAARLHQENRGTPSLHDKERRYSTWLLWWIILALGGERHYQESSMPQPIVINFVNTLSRPKRPCVRRTMLFSYRKRHLMTWITLVGRLQPPAQFYHSHNQLLAALSRRIGEGAKAQTPTPYKTRY